MTDEESREEAESDDRPVEPYEVQSDVGTRVWHADDARHAREQHEESFPEEPVIAARRRQFHLSTYRVRVLSEAPIPDTLDLREVLEEADTGSFVADWAPCRGREIPPRRCAELLYEFGSDPAFFELDLLGVEPRRMP